MKTMSILKKTKDRRKKKIEDVGKHLGKKSFLALFCVGGLGRGEGE